MKELVFESDDMPDADDISVLEQGVREFNRGIAGPSRSKPLAVFLRDAEGAVLGGVAGRTVYGSFIIHVMWIAPSLRRQGLGRRLMEKAEAGARSRGCNSAQVDTLSFQGLEFYQRLGFTVAGEVPDFPRGHSRFFLVKNL